MAERWLGGKRTEPKLDQGLGMRLGVKPADPSSERRLGGKLNAYVPRGAQYDYKPPSVFARYKVLTGVFLALALFLMSYWMFVSRQPPAAAVQPAPLKSAPRSAPTPAPQMPQDQPVYIEPLPAK
jgi:hypothetical protein